MEEVTSLIKTKKVEMFLRYSDLNSNTKRRLFGKVLEVTRIFKEKTKHQFKTNPDIIFKKISKHFNEFNFEKTQDSQVKRQIELIQKLLKERNDYINKFIAESVDLIEQIISNDRTTKGNSLN